MELVETDYRIKLTCIYCTIHYTLIQTRLPYDNIKGSNFSILE